MRDEQLRELYARAMQRRRGGSRAGCVPEDLLLAVAKGDAPASERPVVLDHVAQCPDCRADFELLRTVSGDRLVARRRVPLLALAASLAALAGAAVLVWQGRPGSSDAWRGGDAVALVAPIGAVSPQAPLQFVWHAVRGAVAYDLEVFDVQGTAVWTTRTQDTAVALPTPVPLAAGIDYLWRVRAERSDGSQERSTAGRFRIQRR